jgi:hypothetical protein
MARNDKYKGRNLGRLMLDWVINEAVCFSKKIGCRLVIPLSGNLKSITVLIKRTQISINTRITNHQL